MARIVKPLSLWFAKIKIASVSIVGTKMHAMQKVPSRARRAAAALLAVCYLAGSANAAEAMRCGSLAGTEAFRMRYLQSRLMVAALGCNQQAAYNTFVEHFRPSLAGAGNTITAYFVRVGGGQTALNRHITDLANAAGLSRAVDPDGFCKHVWELFWHLEQEPYQLKRLAEENTLLDVTQPQACSVTVSGDPPAKNITATFDAAKAEAVEE